MKKAVVTNSIVLATVVPLLLLSGCGTNPKAAEAGKGVSEVQSIPLEIKCAPNQIAVGLNTQVWTTAPFNSSGFGVSSFGFICRDIVTGVLYNSPIVGGNNGRAYDRFVCPGNNFLAAVVGVNEGTSPEVPAGFNTLNSLAYFSFVCRSPSHVSFPGDPNSKIYGDRTYPRATSGQPFYFTCPNSINSVIVNGLAPTGSVGKALGVTCRNM